MLLFVEIANLGVGVCNNGQQFWGPMKNVTRLSNLDCQHATMPQWVLLVPFFVTPNMKLEAIYVIVGGIDKDLHFPQIRPIHPHRSLDKQPKAAPGSGGLVTKSCYHANVTVDKRIQIMLMGPL